MRFVVPLLLLATSAVAHEVEKAHYRESGKLLYYWRPKLPIPKGWMRANGGSTFKLNMLLKDYKFPVSAPTMIIGEAIYELDPSKPGDLQGFISRELGKENTGNGPYKVNILKLPSMKTRSGATFPTYFFSIVGARYDRVLYLRDGKFWVKLILSLKRPSDSTWALPVFRKLVHDYRPGK